MCAHDFTYLFVKQISWLAKLHLWLSGLNEYFHGNTPQTKGSSSLQRAVSSHQSQQLQFYAHADMIRDYSLPSVLPIPALQSSSQRIDSLTSNQAPLSPLHVFSPIDRLQELLQPNNLHVVQPIVKSSRDPSRKSQDYRRTESPWQAGARRS